jgi:hypothetical protein
MKTKPKLILCALIFAVGGIANLFFSTALHELLLRRMTVLKLLPIGQCLTSLFTSRQHFLLFLCLQGFVLVLSLLFFFTNLRPYQSDLNEITPEIQTPVAVGQYQHGSARWLRGPEKRKKFESAVLDPDNKVIKALIDSGYNDLDFLKAKEKEPEKAATPPDTG